MLGFAIDFLLVLIFIGLLVSIIRKRNKYPYKSLGIWFITSLFIDTILTAIFTNYSKILLVISFVALVCIWLVTYRVILKDKRRLLIGFLFNVSLVATLSYILLIGISLATPLMIGMLLVVGLSFFITITYGGYALILFFLWNARVVLKKESRSFANMLTLFLGIFGLFFLLGGWVNDLLQTESLYFYIYSCVFWIFGYYFLCFCTVLSSTILFNILKPKMNKDFLIVLGAGLLDGEKVSPLLAGRINRAIQFMNEQLTLTGKQAILLMSGGQGGDEKIPESVAMKHFAMEQGVAEKNILTEEKSTTTLENLRFSDEIMQEKKGANYESSFVSNEYHIFRAGLFARKLGMKSDGLGSKTARYYLPNAFIREFIAIVLINKKRHLIINALIVLFLIANAVLKAFFVR
ncbi:DUF218 domain-containing protein [Pilibacter termitis]|uniref:DUF218 domain-containing protein n=1 Tax=Pilibacter termitis TaxID=263852 RepID=A0A1T4P0U2_9ENTE|nr:YdcF family protein [Pilibacter termitis]SJZ84866.1 DUF218 domain-containing protein [Pilibacter termitis]